MSEPVRQGEFQRAIDALSRQIGEVAATSRLTLEEARRTNGRVNGLEFRAQASERRLETLEREPDKEAPAPAPTGESRPLTRGDLAAAVAVAVALIEVLRFIGKV